MAFNITIDPFSWISAWRRDTKVFEWMTLLTSLVFSASVSGCFATGSALVAHRPQWEALGAGLVAAAVFSTVTWRRSPLTKGTTVALPAGEATAEVTTDGQVITKP